MGNINLFFKPDLRRILLLVIIGVLYSLFWFLITLVTPCEDCVVTDLDGNTSVLFGYPLPFSLNFSLLISEQYPMLFSIVFIIIDSFIWYLLACEIVLVHGIWGRKIFVKEIPKQTSQTTERSSEQPSSEPQPQA